MEVTGKIVKILDKVTGQKKDGSGEWQKQEFVLQTEEQYNNIYCFEVFGDKVDEFNKYQKLEDTVKVDFNVKCNEYNGKYYTSLSAWKVFKADVNAPAAAPTQVAAPATDDGFDDGLPF